MSIVTVTCAASPVLVVRIMRFRRGSGAAILGTNFWPMPPAAVAVPTSEEIRPGHQKLMERSYQLSLVYPYTILITRYSYATATRVTRAPRSGVAGSPRSLVLSGSGDYESLGWTGHPAGPCCLSHS